MNERLKFTNRCTFPRCTGTFNESLVGIPYGHARLTGWEFDEHEPDDIPAHDHVARGAA